MRKNSDLSNLNGLDLEIIPSDLNDPQLHTHMTDCQYLFHVAAQYSLWNKDRELLYQNNVAGTKNILRSARQAGIKRTVYTSSVAAIGVRKDGILTDETYQSPVENLIGNYKKSKYYAEQQAHKAIANGQDIVIVNPTTPIGAYDIKPTPTGEIIVRFLNNNMPAFVNTGLNFIDVKDVAMGHLLALTKGKTGERYILGNQNLTLQEFLQKLAKITGKKAPTIQLPLWFPLTIAFCDEYLLSKLGKKPSIALEAVKMSGQFMYYNCQKSMEKLRLPQTNIDSAIQNAIEWFIEN